MIKNKKCQTQLKEKINTISNQMKQAMNAEYKALENNRIALTRQLNKAIEEFIKEREMFIAKAFDEAFNFNDGITYYVSDPFNENTQYSMRNGLVNFMDTPNTDYHLIIYLNENGKFINKYKDTWKEQLQSDWHRWQKELKYKAYNNTQSIFESVNM